MYIKDISWNSLAVASSTCTQLLKIYLATQLLSIEGFGFYSIILLFSSLQFLLADFGYINFIIKSKELSYVSFRRVLVFLCKWNIFLILTSTLLFILANKFFNLDNNTDWNVRLVGLYFL